MCSETPPVLNSRRATPPRDHAHQRQTARHQQHRRRLRNHHDILADGHAIERGLGDEPVHGGRRMPVVESRFEFGEYLVNQLAKNDFATPMAPEADAFWPWVAAVYFDQLSAPTERNRKPKQREHFVVVRDGFKGSLHYRHGPRTCFEMVSIHGQSAMVCLSVAMGAFGDMAEQLTSRFNIARDVGYFRAASKLYLRGNKLVSGASSPARHPRNASQESEGDWEVREG